MLSVVFVSSELEEVVAASDCIIVLAAGRSAGSPSGYIRDWLAPPWREPTLEELLSEPIITALMDADDVDAEELKAILARTSVQLRSRLTG